LQFSALALTVAFRRRNRTVKNMIIMFHLSQSVPLSI